MEKCRPVIGPNSGFMRELFEFEKRIYGGKTSVKEFREVDVYRMFFGDLLREYVGL